MGARGAGRGTRVGRDRGNQDRTGRGDGNCNVGLPVQGRASGPLSHPEPGHTYLQQHAENVPADDEEFGRGCRHCRHGSENAGRVVESECCRRPRVRRGPLVSRSPLLGALPQPRLPRLKYPPTTPLRMRRWGGSMRRGSQGRSSFARRGKNNPSALSTPTPASCVSS